MDLFPVVSHFSFVPFFNDISASKSSNQRGGGGGVKGGAGGAGGGEGVQLNLWVWEGMEKLVP